MHALVVEYLASLADRVVSSLHGQAETVGHTLVSHRNLCVRRKGLGDGLEQSPIQALQEGLAHALDIRPRHRASKSQFWHLGKAVRPAFRRRLRAYFHGSVLVYVVLAEL